MAKTLDYLFVVTLFYFNYFLVDTAHKVFGFCSVLKQIFDGVSFQKNEMIFERFICKNGTSTKIQVHDCWVKKVGRIGSDRISILINTTILEPISDLFVSTSMFVKYQTYRQFPFFDGGDVCGWFNGTKHSNIMDWTFKQVQKYAHYDSEYKCPFIGNFVIKVNNISLNEKIPLLLILPSRRFIFESNVTEGYQGTILMLGKYYFSISDHRIEQYD